MADFTQVLPAFPYSSVSSEEQQGIVHPDSSPDLVTQEEQARTVVLNYSTGSDDVTPPTVTVVSPAPGAELARNGAVTFDVTDDLGLRDVVVWVEIAGAWEVVYGGAVAGFAPAYSSSSKSPISSGFQFVVRRAGSWIASPTFHALAFDTGGNAS